MARIPEPVPISRKDLRCPDARLDANCSRQKAVVGCCPVPKLRPGSSTTTAWPARGRRPLQVGLINRARLISNGLKCFFHDSLQFSGATLRIVILPEAMFRPQFRTFFNAVRSRARSSVSRSGSFGQQAETVAVDVAASE